jgi:hypothetical protein
MSDPANRGTDQPGQSAWVGVTLHYLPTSRTHAHAHTRKTLRLTSMKPGSYPFMGTR